MAIVNVDRGYKLSKLEQIEDPETSGKNLNDEALFLVSDTEDGSTYVRPQPNGYATSRSYT